MVKFYEHIQDSLIFILNGGTDLKFEKFTFQPLNAPLFLVRFFYIRCGNLLHSTRRFVLESSWIYAFSFNQRDLYPILLIVEIFGWTTVLWYFLSHVGEISMLKIVYILCCWFLFASIFFGSHRLGEK